MKALPDVPPEAAEGRRRSSSAASTMLLDSASVHTRSSLDLAASTQLPMARSLESNIHLGYGASRAGRVVDRARARSQLLFPRCIVGWCGGSRVEAHTSLHRRLGFVAFEPGAHVLPPLTIGADPDRSGSARYTVHVPQPLRVVVNPASHVPSGVVAPATAVAAASTL